MHVVVAAVNPVGDSRRRAGYFEPDQYLNLKANVGVLKHNTLLGGIYIGPFK